MLTDEIKKSLQESVLCWLATVNEAGVPNCSPKEVFTFRGDSELVIANIASPESVKNIQVNPQVCVSFVHVFKQKGFKLKGCAEYVKPGDTAFPELFLLVHPMVGDIFPVQGIILVRINSVAPILAPSYVLLDGVSEESQINNARKTYGVD